MNLSMKKKNKVAHLLDTETLALGQVMDSLIPIQK